MKKLIAIALLAPSLMLGDELADLEAEYAKKLFEAQRSLAEAELEKMESQYRIAEANGEARTRMLLGSRITALSEKLSSKQPLLFGPASSEQEGKTKLKDRDAERAARIPTLPKVREVPLLLASRRGTVEYNQADDRLVGWTAGSTATWPSNLAFAPGVYEVVLTFSCPPAGGGPITIDVPGTDPKIMLGTGDLSTESWDDYQTRVVAEFEISEKYAGRDFDFGIRVLTKQEIPSEQETFRLARIVLRLKGAEEETPE